MWVIKKGVTLTRALCTTLSIVGTFEMFCEIAFTLVYFFGSEMREKVCELVNKVKNVK